MFILEKGASGSVVTSIQVALHMLRFYRMTIDGHFGEGTKTAVMDFQEAFDLNVTGTVDPATYAAIRSEVAPILKALKAKGYNIVNTSGVCSMTDYNELLQFQSDCGLTVDGFVGPATRHHLYNTMNVTSSTVFQSGDKGEEVKTLQYALTVLCCHPGPIDGSFGPQTLEAVKVYQGKHGYTKTGTVNQTLWNSICSQISVIMTALDTEGYEFSSTGGIADKGFYDALKQFQRDNSLVVDGLCGPATRAALGLTYASENDSFPLSKGSSGNNVLNLQYALWLLQIDPNGFDSSFGNGCKNAVQTFQTSKSMTATGIVDTATWEAIRADILPIQQALVNHGYDIGGNPDGVATKATYDAVKAFQTDHNLTADGLVGTATKAALGISSGTYTGTTTAYVVRGSKGSIVRYLQNVLNYLGYSVTVDGSFGPAMENVVMDFQEDNNLTVDGHFGPASWRKLFDLYNPTVTGTTNAEKLVSIAQHELLYAYAEDNSNNITPYGQWYDPYDSSWNGQAWCAMFVTFCARKAGIAGTTVPVYAYCPSGVEWYRSRGRYFKRSSDYTPNVGDVVFFYSSDLGRVAHTGIVIECTSVYIKTIEGNASDGVREKYYGRSDSKIDGYGCNQSTVPYTVPTQQQIDAKLSQVYNSILSLYGIERSDSGYLQAYAVQPTGEDSLSVIAGIEASAPSIPGMHFYAIENDNMTALGSQVDDYLALVGSYIEEQSIRNTINEIESIVSEGAYGYRAYKSGTGSNAKIVTESYYRVLFRDTSYLQKTFYVKVTHDVLVSKYLLISGRSEPENSDEFDEVLNYYDTNQIAELVFVINRIVKKCHQNETSGTFTSFLAGELEVLPFTMAKELRRQILHDILEGISQTLWDIVEDYLDTHSASFELETPLMIMNTGVAQVTLIFGQSIGTEAHTFETTVSLSNPTGLTGVLNNVETTITAAIGNNMQISAFIENLTDLGIELGNGTFNFSNTINPNGGITYEFRIDFPEDEIIPGATGNFYISIEVFSQNSSAIDPALVSNSLVAYNDEVFDYAQQNQEMPDFGVVLTFVVVVMGVCIFSEYAPLLFPALAGVFE